MGFLEHYRAFKEKQLKMNDDTGQFLTSEDMSQGDDEDLAQLVQAARLGSGSIHLAKSIKGESDRSFMIAKKMHRALDQAEARADFAEQLAARGWVSCFRPPTTLLSFISQSSHVLTLPSFLSYTHTHTLSKIRS